MLALSPTLLLALSLSSLSLASPVPATGTVIPLTKRNDHRHILSRDTTSLPAANLTWFLEQEGHLLAKYAATLSAAEVNLGKALDGFSSSAVREAAASAAGLLPKRAAAGEALTSQQSGSYWTGTISVGTPAQNFGVDFDTGSSDLWIQSTSCSSCSGAEYNPSASSSSVNQGRTFTISYGDGSQTSGEVYTDKVTVAGLTATGQAVGAASSVDSTTGAGFSGLLGMGYQALSTENASPYFATLVSEKVVSTGTFAFRLSSSGSELYLGGVDTAKYSGAITYTPVTQQAYWQVSLSAVSVAGSTVVSSGSRAAIIDTGTTLIYSNAADAKAFYAKIPNSHPLSYFGYSSTTYAGYYAVPCNGNTAISLAFGGTAFPISYAGFVNQGTVGSSGGTQYCLGALIGTNSAANGLGSSWLVGDAFLTNVYAVFDLSNNRVGFATPR